MSERGLTDLIVTIMAAGEVSALPARDHRRCHEALMRLVDCGSPASHRLLARHGGVPRWHVGARYGREVDEVAPSLWELVNRGHMRAMETDDDAAYVMTADASVAGRRALLRLPADEAELVTQTGVAWAAASTSRKKPARPAASPGATRRVSLA